MAMKDAFHHEGYNTRCCHLLELCTCNLMGKFGDLLGNHMGIS